ncbi:hypothetical protein HS088_TW13G00035 [Tripterygium wilfordii]|uniref:Uncharacterized protein n=1 Tax=Tripterygium wilfordii TaxID=458696 RepID=A0A7J7CSR6_TRIWF|nr:hypothetical protein HS088_TW13G00035 [Tripterygium wilfordii]
MDEDDAPAGGSGAGPKIEEVTTTYLMKVSIFEFNKSRRHHFRQRNREDHGQGCQQKQTIITITAQIN